MAAAPPPPPPPGFAAYVGAPATSVQVNKKYKWINYVQQEFKASEFSKRITRDFSITNKDTIFQTVSDELETQYEKNGEPNVNIFKTVDFNQLNKLLEARPTSTEMSLQSAIQVLVPLDRRRVPLDSLVTLVFHAMKQQIIHKKLGASSSQQSYPVTVNGLTMNAANAQVVKLMLAIANCCVDQMLSAEDISRCLHEIVQIRYQKTSAEVLETNPIFLALPVDYSLHEEAQIIKVSSLQAASTTTSSEETAPVSKQSLTIEVDEQELQSILHTPVQLAKLVEMLIASCRWLSVDIEVEHAVATSLEAHGKQRILQDDPVGSLIVEISSSAMLTHFVNEILRTVKILSSLHFYQESQLLRMQHQAEEIRHSKALAKLLKTIQIHVHRLVKGLLTDASSIKPEQHSIAPESLSSIIGLRSSFDSSLSLGHYLAYMLKNREPELLDQLARLSFCEEGQIRETTSALQQLTFTSSTELHGDAEHIQKHNQHMKNQFVKAVNLSNAISNYHAELAHYFLCSGDLETIRSLVTSITQLAHNNEHMQKVADALKHSEATKSEEITATSKRFVAGLTFIKGENSVYASEEVPIAQDIREYYALFVKKYPKKQDPVASESALTTQSLDAETVIKEMPESQPVLNVLSLSKFYDVDSFMETLVTFDASHFKNIVEYPMYIEFLTLAGHVLPHELVLLILQHFGLSELMRFSKASKAAFYFAHHPALINGSRLRPLCKIPHKLFESVINNSPVIENCGPLLQYKIYSVLKRLVMPATHDVNRYVLKTLETSPHTEHQKAHKLVTKLKDTSFSAAAHILMRVTEASESCKRFLLLFDIPVRCFDLLLNSEALKGLIKLLMILTACRKNDNEIFGIGLADLGKLVRIKPNVQRSNKSFLRYVKEIYWDKMCADLSFQRERQLIKLCLKELEKAETMDPQSLSKLVSNMTFVNIKKGAYDHHRIVVPPKLQKRVQDLFTFWHSKAQLQKIGIEQREKLAIKFFRYTMSHNTKEFLQNLLAVFDVLDPPEQHEEEEEGTESAEDSEEL